MYDMIFSTYEHLFEIRALYCNFEIAENHAYSQRLFRQKVRMQVSPWTISRSDWAVPSLLWYLYRSITSTFKCILWHFPFKLKLQIEHEIASSWLEYFIHIDRKMRPIAYSQLWSCSNEKIYKFQLISPLHITRI